MKVHLSACDGLDLHSRALSQEAETSAATLQLPRLTPRQRQVLGFLLRGYSNKLIARALNLSVETIKDHVAAVLRALKVSSRTQAVVAVSHMSFAGLSSPPGTKSSSPAPAMSSDRP
jgi:DNA-binding NarL/FixJ family response regulator